MCNMRELRSIESGALAGLENLQSLHVSFNPKLTFLDPRALARPDDIGETYDWPTIKEVDKMLGGKTFCRCVETSKSKRATKNVIKIC